MVIMLYFLFFISFWSWIKWVLLWSDWIFRWKIVSLEYVEKFLFRFFEFWDWFWLFFCLFILFCLSDWRLCKFVDFCCLYSIGFWCCNIVEILKILLWFDSLEWFFLLCMIFWFLRMLWRWLEIGYFDFRFNNLFFEYFIVLVVWEFKFKYGWFLILFFWFFWVFGFGFVLIFICIVRLIKKVCFGRVKVI